MGKSSLINAVTGRKAIARTSKRPGKTRDCNVYLVDDRFYLVDLPGYGYANVGRSERQRLGRLIEAYLAVRKQLAGVVWLLDVRRTPSEGDHHLAERLADLNIPAFVAITKGDKLSGGKRAESARAIMDSLGLPQNQSLITSAVTKEGIDELRDTITTLAVEQRAGGRP